MILSKVGQDLRRHLSRGVCSGIMPTIVLLGATPSVGVFIITGLQKRFTLGRYDRRPFVLVDYMGYRPDKEKGHRAQYEKNKKRVFATQTICGICGRPVDFSLKYPHPLSPTVDHIVPVSKGGHPSDIDNLQLAHRCCNRQKSDKLIERKTESKEATLSPRVLPQTFDWCSKPLRATGTIAK